MQSKLPTALLRWLYRTLLATGFLAIAALFILGGLALIVFAGLELWRAIDPAAARSLSQRFEGVLQGIAMLTIAMASLELADTVVEDEFRSDRRSGVAARIRRVLARFFVVVIVSMAIESLVAVFKFVHGDPASIAQAAYIALAAAALLAAWGLFMRFDRPASRNSA